MSPAFKKNFLSNVEVIKAMNYLLLAIIKVVEVKIFQNNIQDKHEQFSFDFAR